MVPYSGIGKMATGRRKHPVSPCLLFTHRLSWKVDGIQGRHAHGHDRSRIRVPLIRLIDVNTPMGKGLGKMHSALEAVGQSCETNVTRTSLDLKKWILKDEHKLQEKDKHEVHGNGLKKVVSRHASAFSTAASKILRYLLLYSANSQSRPVLNFWTRGSKISNPFRYSINWGYRFFKEDHV